MLKSVKLGKEIEVTAANKVGVLADISNLISGKGINVEAVVGYVREDKKEADIMFLTGDNRSTMDLLAKSGYKARENEVIVIELENKPGALKDISAKLAQGGVDIKYIYGTTCAGTCAARMVISTSDNKKALEALKK